MFKVSAEQRMVSAAKEVEIFFVATPHGQAFLTQKMKDFERARGQALAHFESLIQDVRALSFDQYCASLRVRTEGYG